MKPAYLLPLLVLMAGCTTPPPIDPAISDIRESMVKVRTQQSGVPGGWVGSWPTKADIQKTADTGCQRYGRHATGMSRFCVVPSQSMYRVCEIHEYLFTCDTPDETGS